MDADVLIVGAGPTGLMLAVQLLRRGVRVLVIERNAGPARETRALGVQARTLEFYAQIGIAERAIALGRRATGVQLWADGEHEARVPLSDAGHAQTPYPFLLVLGQDDNERLLGEALRDGGGDVLWNVTLQSLEQRDDHVVATVREAGGTERVLTVGWVAGCDGAHSAVRHLAGIDFPGAPYEHVFFVADVNCRGSMRADEVNVYLWRSGFHLLFPMRGEDHWRIVGIVPPELHDRPALRFDDVEPDLRRQVGDRFRVDSCTWFSTYRIHHRRAATFRRRRCFLLGDAAHIHSPVGAQGMNTGLQDACNLAWKLALVVRGGATDPLLDSYDEERGAVAQRLLDSTDRAFRLIVADGPFAGLLRTGVLARLAAMLMSRPRIQQSAFRTISQIGIHYRKHRLSAEDAATMPAGAPRAGDRFPWMQLQLTEADAPIDLFSRIDGRGYLLLLFGQAAPAVPAERDVCETLAFPESRANARECERVGISTPSFFLLRPDGYIGLRGASFEPEDLRRYLGRTLRASEPHR